jgi:hypothetical protein
VVCIREDLNFPVAKDHALKTYRGVEETIYEFKTSELEVKEWAVLPSKKYPQITD